MMRSRERLLELRSVLEEERKLILRDIANLSEAKVLADPANRFRYERLQEKRQEEHDKLVEHIEIIEAKLKEGDFAFDDDLLRIEAAFLGGLISHLGELKTMHHTLHYVLEDVIELSSTLFLCQRQKATGVLAEHLMLQVQLAWGKCHPNLAASCSIFRNFEKLQYEVIRDYLTGVGELRDKFNDIMYEPPSLKNLDHLTNLCTDLKSYVLPAVRVADTEILNLVSRIERWGKVRKGANQW